MTSKLARRIDWEALRTRLTNANEASLRRHTNSSERQREVLERRARELSKVSAEPDTKRARLAVVEFALAQETYAIDLTCVLEVVALGDYTPLPGTAAFVVGIANYRGRLLSLVDLRKFFQLPAAGLTELNRIVVLRDRATELGLLTDAVHSVREVLLDELQASTSASNGLRTRFSRGVDARGVILLNETALLSAQELRGYVDDGRLLERTSRADAEHPPQTRRAT